MTYEEPYRPQFHFSPADNWMNDPNGLVYYDGEYHLFYQYNPFGIRWGHMSWGHAVSRDLVHWEHLPVAIPEGHGIMAFSGSAVVDWRNTTGFGTDEKPPIVAVYTAYRPRDGHQSQYVAYSLDDGRTFITYDGNPVLDIGSTSFRDPKVFWYEPDEKWVMVVVKADDRQVSFYASTDLKAWTHLSDFGPLNAVGGVWECPDLFELPVDGHPSDTRWVLQVDLNPGALMGGSGGQYFIGQFDGTSFTLDQPITAYVPPAGTVLADFDGTDWAGWTADGTAFGSGPTGGSLDGQPTVFRHEGTGFANSFHGGNSSTGTLTSPPFEIDSDHLNFLVGGGHGRDTRVVLLVDGEEVREARGEGGAWLDWVAWDVSDLSGRVGRVRLIDAATGEWGHIMADRFTLADAPARSSAQRSRWVDYGMDFYAVVSWSDVPREDGRRIWMAWMNNWLYGQDIPTSPWRSAQSLPRVVTLQTIGGHVQLVQQPVVELQQLRREHVRLADVQIPAGGIDLDLRGTQLEIVAEFEVGDADVVGLTVRKGDGESTFVGYDVVAGELVVDRTRSGQTGFHEAFPARQAGPLTVEDGIVRLHVFVDWSSVEVFGGRGQTVIASRIFPDAGSDRVAAYAEGGTAVLKSLNAWTLASIWDGYATTRVQRGDP